MQRERNFKIYLSNPSNRAALFQPVKPNDSTLIGHLAESAVVSQWQHSLSFSCLRYARWPRGEVDVVFLDPATQKAHWAGEIKWSDQISGNRDKELGHLRTLLTNQPSIRSGFITTKTVAQDSIVVAGRNVRIQPTALYCYTVGRNAALNTASLMALEDMDEAGDE